MSTVIFTKKEFDALKLNAEKTYKQIGEIHCPYLGSKVAFNIKGFNHLKMKSWNHARNEHDQYMRLKLIGFAPEIIRSSHTLQGIEKGNRFERIKISSRWEKKMMFVSYYEFIAIVEDHRMRIIVKQVENSQPYFWSIVPYWKQTAHRARKMFEGNSEED